MILVTGAAGFIGSNLVHALRARGVDVFAVDNLSHGDKFLNIVDTGIADFVDQDVFLDRLQRGDYAGKFTAVVHQGACSDTMVADGRYMLQTNYRCSKNLLDACASQGCRLLYASSGAIYGSSTAFREEPACEAPLNVYGYSKLLFDQVVRKHLAAGTHAQVVGLRYFNVYGPREQHKGRMASVAFHHEQAHQTITNRTVMLAELCGDYVVPPAFVELMYQTEVRGHSGTFAMKVKE